MLRKKTGVCVTEELSEKRHMKAMMSSKCNLDLFFVLLLINLDFCFVLGSQIFKAEVVVLNIGVCGGGGLWC